MKISPNINRFQRRGAKDLTTRQEYEFKPPREKELKISVRKGRPKKKKRNILYHGRGSSFAISRETCPKMSSVGVLLIMKHLVSQI